MDSLGYRIRISKGAQLTSQEGARHVNNGTCRQLDPFSLLTTDESKRSGWMNTGWNKIWRIWSMELG